MHQRDLPVFKPCCVHFPALTLHPIRTRLSDLQHARGLRFKLQRGLAKLRSRALSGLSLISPPLNFADERPSPLGISSLRMFILNRRFFIARQLLRACSAEHDAVLLADSRDVVFQANPFSIMNYGLFTGQEVNNLCDSPINAQWMRSTYGEAGFARLKDLPVLCSGVTLGGVSSVLAYLDRFCAEISRHAVARRSVLIPIWDQAYHNMILRDHPPAQFNPMPWHSQIATVGEVPSEFLEVQPDGYISVNGKVPAILHQYDRHSAVVECISEQYTVPSTFKTFLTGG